MEGEIKNGGIKNYRINRSDIELATLRKIIEIGLGERMEILIK